MYPVSATFTDQNMQRRDTVIYHIRIKFHDSLFSCSICELFTHTWLSPVCVEHKSHYHDLPFISDACHCYCILLQANFYQMLDQTEAKWVDHVPKGRHQQPGWVASHPSLMSYKVWLIIIALAREQQCSRHTAVSFRTFIFLSLSYLKSKYWNIHKYNFVSLRMGCETCSVI